MDTQVIAAQMRTFLETFEKLVEENSTLQEHLIMRNCEITNLKKENKKLEEEVSNLKFENEDLCDNCSRLEEEVDELRDGEDRFRDNMIDGLQAEIKQLKEALNKVRRDLSPPR